MVCGATASPEPGLFFIEFLFRFKEPVKAIGDQSIHRLHRQEVSAMGRYEVGSLAAFPGFKSGITVDSFHCGGSVDVDSSTLKRCSKWPLFSGDRRLNIEFLTRSGPTALLLNLGMLISCSSGVMASFRRLWMV